LGNSQTELITELTAGRPAILAEPGHFIVAKSQTSDSFGINDPAYTTRPTLTSYGNTFTNLGSYRPTHTDLSYIMLVADQDINIDLGIPGDQFIQQSLIDDVSNIGFSGDPVKIFFLPTPEIGSYTAKLTGSPGSYQFDSYLYDQQGNVVKNTFSGLLSNSEEDKFLIQYQTIGKTVPLVTIDTILQDLEDGYSQGLIKKQVYAPLKIGLLNAKKLINKNQKFAAKALLKSLLVVIKTAPNKYLDKVARNILKTDIETLISSL